MTEPHTSGSVEDDYIAIDKTYITENENLVECFRQRDGDLQKKMEPFHGALDRLELKYAPHGNGEPVGDDMRRQWRRERILLYDNSLILALHAENDKWDKWTSSESAGDLWKERFGKDFSKTESIVKYVLDIIHEDEEIMSKFYYTKTGEGEGEGKGEDKEKGSMFKRKDKGKAADLKWRPGDTFWLEQCIKKYRFHFFEVVLDALKDWNEKNEKIDCMNAVENAMNVFKDTLSRHKIRGVARSWRGRARLYWLLGLARRSSISNGELGSFKGYDFTGPIGILINSLIEKDEDLLKGKVESLLFDYNRVKYLDKKKKDLCIGHLKVCSVLSWASAVNDYNLIAIVVKQRSYLQMDRIGRVKTDPRFEYQWSEHWEEDWAMALWNAAYKGHKKVVHELLLCDYSYRELYSEYFAPNSLEPPLHVAVYRGHTSVVEAFCSTTSNIYNCHEVNSQDQTPLEVATILKKKQSSNDRSTKKLSQIQFLLLRRPEVRDAVDESKNQRQLAVDSANAIMVGATLLAGIAFGGWLSPPLGYNSYYQFADSSTGAPPDSFESYMSVQGHTTIQVFALFNSLAFFVAIASVIAGIETMYSIQSVEDIYMPKTVQKLQTKLRWATSLFLACVLCVLIAFATAGIAILPPIKRYQTNMYITIALGGFICGGFICKMLWYCVSKDYRNFVLSKFALEKEQRGQATRASTSASTR